jgi:hypothetical protein
MKCGISERNHVDQEKSVESVRTEKALNVYCSEVICVGLKMQIHNRQHNRWPFVGQIRQGGLILSSLWALQHRPERTVMGIRFLVAAFWTTAPDDPWLGDDNYKLLQSLPHSLPQACGKAHPVTSLKTKSLWKSHFGYLNIG